MATNLGPNELRSQKIVKCRIFFLDPLQPVQFLKVQRKSEAFFQDPKRRDLKTECYFIPCTLFSEADLRINKMYLQLAGACSQVRCVLKRRLIG